MKQEQMTLKKLIKTLFAHHPSINDVTIECDIDVDGFVYPKGQGTASIQLKWIRTKPHNPFSGRILYEPDLHTPNGFTVFSSRDIGESFAEEMESILKEGSSKN